MKFGIKYKPTINTVNISENIRSKNQLFHYQSSKDSFNYLKESSSKVIKNAPINHICNQYPLFIIPKEKQKALLPTMA